MSDELGTCDTALGPHEKEPACENWKPLAASAPKPEASAEGPSLEEWLQAHRVILTSGQLQAVKGFIVMNMIPCSTHAEEREAAVAAVIERWQNEFGKMVEIHDRLLAERDAAQKDVEYWRTLAWKDAGGLAALELERVRAALAEAKFWHVDHDCTVFPERDNCRHVAKLQSREKELTQQLGSK